MTSDNLLENEVANLRARLLEKTEKTRGFENHFIWCCLKLFCQNLSKVTRKI